MRRFANQTVIMAVSSAPSNAKNATKTVPFAQSDGRGAGACARVSAIVVEVDAGEAGGTTTTADAGVLAGFAAAGTGAGDEADV
jgi:hypothetical protein